MTREHELTLIGVLISAAGAALAMMGTILQMNGYYAFEKGEFIKHIGRMAWTLLRRGPLAAMQRVNATVAIAAERGEKRSVTMLGLYFVMLGFLLQTVGAAVTIWPLF